MMPSDSALNDAKQLSPDAKPALLVAAKIASAMCGKSLRTWRTWDSAGLIPRPVRIEHLGAQVGQQIVLALEVEIEGALRDAGLADDRRHARLGEPLGEEQLLGRIEQLSPPRPAALDLELGGRRRR